MTEKAYTPFSTEIVQQLKNQGYKSVQLVLLDTCDKQQATVEMIPGKEDNSDMDRISIYSDEIGEYAGINSVMTRYVIDQTYISALTP